MQMAGAVRSLAWVGALVVGLEGQVSAQDNPPAHHAPPDARSGAPPEGSRHIRREPLETDSLADLGRARMRAGDCAGALDAFDAALRASMDPSLLRDRGICQAAMGHPFPAIDDLRAYLTAAADAADADEIRDRLAKLEQESLGYSSASNDVPGDVEGGESQMAAAKRKSQETGARADETETPSAPPEAPAGAVEREDDPMRSPLRAGKGWSIAPFFALHKWGANPSEVALAPGGQGASFSANGTWAECVGIGARYALGRSGALLFEAGYEFFNTTTADVAVVSGLTSQLAFEWRIPLDADFTDELLVVPGLGFEHLAIQPSSPQVSSTSLGGFVPRLRFGWRHMFAASVALEASLDGGAVNFFPYGRFPFDGDGPTSYLIAGGVGVAWGL